MLLKWYNQQIRPLNKMTRRYSKILLIGGLVIIGLLISAHVWYLSQLSQVNLPSLTWQTVPNIIAIQDSDRENHQGILFIKLADGAEQFIAGDWKTSFADSGNVYAFGEFPPNYSSQTGEQLYLIAQDGKIYDIELTSSDPIISIQENRKASYLLIEIKSSQGKIFCVAELNFEKNLECEQINLDSEGLGLWNPQEEHQAVVKNNQGKIFTLDPWDPKLERIDPQDQREKYNELLALFEKQNQHQANTVDSKSFWKIANLVITKDSNQGWSFSPVPIFSKISPLADGEHLLIKESDQLSVLEPATHLLAPVLAEDKIGTKKIQFRNSGFDQSL